MKVLMINTHDDFGGAAIACQRLIEALNRFSDIEVRLLCLEKKLDDLNSKSVGSRVPLYLEKLHFLLFEKSKSTRFAFSTANCGINIINHPWVKEADIIHLHWINLGFLSIQSISKLLQLNKPVFWTFHDMWPITGGCHSSGTCLNYQNQCGNCTQFLKKPGVKDLSFQVLNAKKDWNLKNLQIISISKWMTERISSSSLFKEVFIHKIPNPIDTDVFKILPKKKLRRKWGLKEDQKYLLFSASIIDNYFKGFDLFLALAEVISLKKLDIEVLFTGEFKSYDLSCFPLRYKYFGKINDIHEMAEIYNLTDIYISTSPNESFSYTVLEAASCACFVIAADTGEIRPILSKTGYGKILTKRTADNYFQAIHDFINTKPVVPLEIKKSLNIYSDKSVAHEIVSAYQQVI